MNSLYIQSLSFSNRDDEGILAEAETERLQFETKGWTGVCNTCGRPFTYGYCWCDPEPTEPANTGSEPIDDYAGDEARQTVALISIQCSECGADAYAEGLCHLYRLESETHYECYEDGDDA